MCSHQGQGEGLQQRHYCREIRCTRRIEFDAAHRIVNHESKCRYLHGHRYVIEASFVIEKAEEEGDLDSLGRVIDFGIVKTVLGRWVDEHWDHNVILYEEDSRLGEFIAQELGQEIYYMPYNPTAENMAKYLLCNICPDLFDEYGVKCVAIRLYETPNCYADAEL